MGSKEMLENTVNQAISDFDSIKGAIISEGVEVPNGTDTCEYKDKIHTVADTKYNAGHQSGYDEANETILGGAW